MSEHICGDPASPCDAECMNRYYEFQEQRERARKGQAMTLSEITSRLREKPDIVDVLCNVAERANEGDWDGASHVLAPVVASLLEQQRAELLHETDAHRQELNRLLDACAEAEAETQALRSQLQSAELRYRVERGNVEAAVAETQALREALEQVKSERDLLVAMANSLTTSSATPRREP